MLIQVNYTNKNKSEYFCDICGKRLNSNQIIKIYKYKQDKKKKMYDLCFRCSNLLDKILVDLKYKKGGQIIK